MDVIRSFVGCVRAEKGLLINGAPIAISPRYSEWKDVVAWCDWIITLNKEAGRFPIFNGIRASATKPEMVRAEDGRLYYRGIP